MLKGNKKNLKKALKIAYVSSQQFPSEFTDTKQMIFNANALCGQNLQVDLIVPKQWKSNFFSSKKKTRELETFYGVTAKFNLKTILSLPYTPLRLEKAFHGVFSFFTYLSKKYDVVYSRNVSVIFLATLFGKNTVYENHRELRKSNPFFFFVLSLVRKRKNLLGIITNAKIVENHYHSEGYTSEETVVAYNGHHESKYSENIEKSSARAQKNLPLDDIIVMYTGHINKRKGTEELISMVSKTDALLVVCGGDENQVKWAKTICNKYSFKNYIFTGWILPQELPTYLSAADILAIPPSKVPFEKYGNTVVPIKTFEYLAVGRAIIAPRLPDVCEILNDKNSILVEPNQIEAAAKKLKALIKDPTKQKQLADQAKKDSKKYTWESRAKVISSFLKERLLKLEQSQI